MTNACLNCGEWVTAVLDADESAPPREVLITCPSCKAMAFTVSVNGKLRGEPRVFPGGAVDEAELSAIEGIGSEGVTGRRRTYSFRSSTLILRLAAEVRRLRKENARLTAQLRREGKP